MAPDRCRLQTFAALAACAFLAACSSATTPGDGPRACTKRTDCPTGQGCTDGTCVPFPCGGQCAPEQACVNEVCRPAQGLDCSRDPSVCPANFVCSPSGSCAQTCTEDAACPKDFPSCNADTGFCGECSFNTDCGKDPERRFCDAKTALCVGCVNTASCYGPNSTPQGKYCDPETLTCKTGCHGADECPTGQRCQGGTATVVGRCVECTTATELADCLMAPRTRCEPRTLVCVECLQNGDCSYECNTTKNKCVRCVTNELCDRGSVCEQEANDCVPGCAGGNGGANCPSDKPACDAAFGDHGRCVECLVDADCPRAKVCDKSGPPGSAPRCVPGCNSSETGQPDEARCIDTQGLTPPPADVHCDGSKNAPKGKCVQCRAGNGTDCPADKVCDGNTGMCRCKTLGEPCGSVDECGYIPSTGQCVAYTSTSGRTCINKVECTAGSSLATAMQAKCTYSPVNGACPDGYIARYGIDLRNNRRMECVPREVCGQ